MKNEIKTLLLDHDACYAIVSAHDSRFDGRLFVGVSSTGIYCRPICKVRLPKQENCSFHSNAAEAESFGYRPCLKCRPELAPGNSTMDSVQRIATKAANLIEAGFLDDQNLSQLAAKLKITDRHLRRSFSSEYGVSPVQYLQTTRLLLAKKLLTETRISMTEVAMASGFGSIRRFNDTFKKNYRMAPSKLRKADLKSVHKNDELELALIYRPPYKWEQLLSFLATRFIPGIEYVTNNSYQRTVAITKNNKEHLGWITVTNSAKHNSLIIKLSLSLLPVLSIVITKVRALFDINCEPMKIYEKLQIMSKILPGVCMPGTRLPGSFNEFEMSVRAILGQQVTIKAAKTLAKRFSDKFGESIETPFPELNKIFPRPETICKLDKPIENQLGPLGITGVRCRAILSLSEALSTGYISFAQENEPEDEMNKLLTLPGFGLWTVQYIGMRALAWPDAFPHTDYGVKKALSGKTPKEILQISQAWRPWRSYATINLWNYLGEIN